MITVSECDVVIKTEEDDIYIRLSKGKTPAFVIGYNVEDGYDDGGSRLALILENNRIRLQVIEPYTKKVSYYAITNEEAYENLLNMLKNLAGDIHPEHNSFL